MKSKKMIFITALSNESDNEAIVEIHTQILFSRYNMFF